MNKLQISAYDLAERFIGTSETPGTMSNPLILAMLRLDNPWPAGEDVAWCSAFVNFITWELRLPRSKNLAARSWLNVGKPVPLQSAEIGFDVAVLKRGAADAPGPEVIEAPGHVGFFGGFNGSNLLFILGGNQSDAVNVQQFDAARVLGIRRLV